MQEANGFTLSTKAVIRDEKGQVLLLRRSQASKHNAGKWELPGGKTDAGEEPTDALLREVKEETGLRIQLDGPLGTAESHLGNDEGKRRIAYLIMGARPVEGSSEVRLSSEHDEYRWASLAELEKAEDVAPQFQPFLIEYACEHGKGKDPQAKAAEEEPLDEQTKESTAYKEWLVEQTRKFTNESTAYKELTSVLEKILRRACDRYAPTASVDTRQKTPSSFAEKAIRKKGKYNDPAHQLTDLAGGRIVTYTREEADAACRWIEREPGVRVDWGNSLDTRERLKIGEFGYSARHYVVQLTGQAVLGVDINPSVRRLKCEVQISTYLQHVWAAIGHDRIYKTDLRIPDEIRRDVAEVAALLETADKAFSQTIATLDRYRGDCDAHLSGNEIKAQIDRWEAIRGIDPIPPTRRAEPLTPKQKERLAVLHRLGRLRLAAGQASEAYETMRPLKGWNRPEFERDLGLSAWKFGDVESAREHLQRTIEIDEEDVLARRFLGDTYRGVDEAEARRHYLEAHRRLPDEPRVLVPLVECDLILNRDASVLQMMRGSFRAGIRACESRAAVGVHLPDAYFEHARLALYLEPGEPYEALAAYCRAVHASTGENRVRRELDEIKALVEALEQERSQSLETEPTLQGFVWVRDFLRLALAARLSRKAATEGDTAEVDGLLAGITTDPEHRPRFSEPVLIVAGGCAPVASKDLEEAKPILEKALEHFTGTAVCGGTTAGVSGLTADLLAGRDGVTLLGYVPTDRRHPAEMAERSDEDAKDERYRFVTTRGKGYTALGPIQLWADLLAEGVLPQRVRVLGINGGKLSGFEYRLALALGSFLGIVRETGREAERLLPDAYWQKALGFAPLPRDWASLSAFINGARAEVQQRAGAAWLEDAARAQHESYRRPNLRKPGKVKDNLLPWSKLPELLVASNRDQAAYCALIVQRAGFDLVPLEEGDPFPPPIPAAYFEEEKIEYMSELEHGRYVAERLADGWRLGDENDVEAKTNPTLVAWEDLDEEMRGYDERAVRGFPDVLGRAGLKIVERADPIRE